MGNFYCWLGICFVCYGIRTAYNLAHYRESRLSKKKGIVGTIYGVMGILWFSWFHMCFIDPIRADLPNWLRYTGLVLFIAGVSLFILSHTRLGGFRSKDGLVTGGIYAKVRNPMYLGFIIWVIGLPLFMQSILTLASSLIWIAHIISWKMLEERELLRKHSNYADYMKKTWF